MFCLVCAGQKLAILGHASDVASFAVSNAFEANAFRRPSAFSAATRLLPGRIRDLRDRSSLRVSDGLGSAVHHERIYVHGANLTRLRTLVLHRGRDAGRPAGMHSGMTLV